MPEARAAAPAPATCSTNTKHASAVEAAPETAAAPAGLFPKDKVHSIAGSYAVWYGKVHKLVKWVLSYLIMNQFPLLSLQDNITAALSAFLVQHGGVQLQDDAVLDYLQVTACLTLPACTPIRRH